jgi:hypothetical protein
MTSFWQSILDQQVARPDYSRSIERAIEVLQWQLHDFANVIARQIAEAEESKSASGFFKSLMLELRSEASLVKDDEQLVVLYYNRAGQPIHVYEIQYHNPQMIILWGHDTQGNNYRIPVHMASVELNLMRVKIKRENQEERRIGFSIE